MSSLPLNQIAVGDALAVLRTWPSDSIDCIVTSPPYYGLRSYLPTDHPDKPLELGLEVSPAAYVAKMVELFAEARRVLKPTGTFWLNIGDTYASNWSSRRSGGGAGIGEKPRERVKVTPAGYKPKDLMMMPAQVAIALRGSGWWLRSEIVWVKGKQYDDESLGLNPMPGSQDDRCTSAHEMVYMLSKAQDHYYFDWQAIAEPLSAGSLKRLGQDVEGQLGSERANGGAKSNGPMKAVCFGGTKGGDSCSNPRSRSGNAWTPQRATEGYHAKAQPQKPHQLRAEGGNQFPNQPSLVRPRDVWFIPARGFKEAHFATFPEEVPRRCILAGCPEGGIVLDPFLGSGTTAIVAAGLLRSFAGIELNPDYARMAERRIRKAMGMFAPAEIIMEPASVLP